MGLYMRHEPEHIPLLLRNVENQEPSGRLEAFSDLFNFTVDFEHQQVTVQDDGGYFYSLDEDRKMVIGLAEFVCRLKS
ncbi:MAG: hypothetical protein AAF809_00195 [Bacteroidota bacterium]